MKFGTLLDVMMDILQKRKVTAVELAEKYETSTRTIYRYVDELSFSLPIYVKQGRNGGNKVKQKIWGVRKRLYLPNGNA
jgi:predicted DNA-binding transcriptional regulator YafY